MNYLLNKKKKNKKIRRILLILIILFIIFYFNSFIFSKLNKINYFILKPTSVLYNNAKIRLNNLFVTFSSKEKLIKENVKLKEKKNELESKIINIDYLEKENIYLKETLGRSVNKDNIILASILSKPSISFLFDYLIIDIGEKDNIKEGFLVLAYGNIPIGRIKEVYNNSSKVILFTSPGEKITGIIQDINLYVELEGRGGGNFQIILPRDLEIDKDVLILFPEINNYILAKIKGQITDKRDSFQKVIAVNPVNIEELKFVQVKR